jgi:hypothetical protein
MLNIAVLSVIPKIEMHSGLCGEFVHDPYDHMKHLYQYFCISVLLHYAHT